MAGDDWMGQLSGEACITELAIPGTHDSGACGVADWRPMTQAQTLNITQQLSAGVRALDIRVGPTWTAGYNVFHGPFDQGITINSVVKDITDFLDTNKKEVVLLMLKWETGSDYMAAVNKIVDDALGDKQFPYNPEAERWPLLKECAGKVLVLSRFTTRSKTHFKTEGWAGNFEDKTVVVGGKLNVRIQDLYDKPEVATKIQAVRAAIESAGDNASNEQGRVTLFLNFTSFVWTGFQPKDIGPEYLTPKLLELKAGKAVGVICVDGVTDELAGHLYGLNLKNQ